MTLKELAHLAQQTPHTRAGCPVKRSHVHELLAAAFGHRSWAAFLSNLVLADSGVGAAPTGGLPDLIGRAVQLVAPELRAVGLDEDEQATRVGQLVGTFCRLGRLDLKGRQHWGYRSIRTPNHTPSRSRSQEISRNGLRQGVALSRCHV